MERRIIWLGETKCNMCEARGVSDTEIKGKTLYDAKTVYGQWACMCRNCFNTYGKRGFGGTEYRKDENGDFVKVKNV